MIYQFPLDTALERFPSRAVETEKIEDSSSKVNLSVTTRTTTTGCPKVKQTHYRKISEGKGSKSAIMGVEVLTMISATPSPFARMNRIALHEKGIPFELQNEIPWHGTTETPKYNPLEKLPILLYPDSEVSSPWRLHRSRLKPKRTKNQSTIPPTSRTSSSQNTPIKPRFC